MKYLYILIAFTCFHSSIYSQYLETFSTPNKGILSPGCSSSALSSCSTDFSGENYWTLGGDLSGIDTEGLTTKSGGYLHFVDTDEVSCFISPPIDISAVASSSLVVDFRIPAGTSWESSETIGSIDFADVQYAVDGAPFVTLPNVNGCLASGHTISTSACGVSLVGPQNFAPSISGIVGNSITVMVCVDTNGGSDDGELYSVSIPESGSVVPVTWNNFEAKVVAAGNLLKWSTATEINNDRFEIERSVSRASDFKVISRKEGAGFTAEETFYDFLDEDVTEGNVYYYRIKQIDFDGKISYSRLLSIQTPNSLDYSIGPNPFSHQLELQIHSNASIENTFTLYNAQGMVVKKITVSTNDKVLLQVDNLADGIYFLSADNQEFRKIIKSH